MEEYESKIESEIINYIENCCKSVAENAAHFSYSRVKINNLLFFFFLHEVNNKLHYNV